MMGWRETVEPIERQQHLTKGESTQLAFRPATPSRVAGRSRSLAETTQYAGRWELWQLILGAGGVSVLTGAWSLLNDSPMPAKFC